MLRSQFLGSTMTKKGYRQHVLFYCASKALNTEKGRVGEGVGVNTLASENGRTREIT